MSRLTPITYRIRPATNEDAAAVRAIVFSTLAEFELPALLETADADLNDLKASYFQTGGTFEVVEGPDGGIVGCAGLRIQGNGRAELRNLYLRPEVRRVGLGDLLLKRMVRNARQRGCNEIRLETSPVLWDAKRMYDRYGFTAVTPEHPAARYNQLYCLRFPEGPAPRQAGVQPLPHTWIVLPPSKQPGVPRQFGVGTALWIMTLFAVLFGVLRSLDVPAKEFAYIALFFLGVGAGQALLFHGERPMRASVVMGIVICFALSLFEPIFYQGRPLSASLLVDAVCVSVGAGIIYGYVAGAMISSAFLVSDKLTDAYRCRFPPKDEEA